MKLLIAQGAGFYGCAILTTHATMEEIKAAMRAAGLAIESDHPLIGFKDIPGEEAEQLLVTNPAADFHPQPIPVVVFDTGRAVADLAILNDLLAALRQKS